MNKIYGTSKSMIQLPPKMTIPEIDDQKLKELYHFLKPIVSVENLKYFIREFSIQELRTVSYILNRDENKTNHIDLKDLEPIEDFLCLHSIGNYGLFQPTISQILSQVPKRTIEEANSFEIIEYPKTEDDLERYSELTENGFHLSKVRTYRIKK